MQGSMDSCQLATLARISRDLAELADTAPDVPDLSKMLRLSKLLLGQQQREPAAFAGQPDDVLYLIASHLELHSRLGFAATTKQIRSTLGADVANVLWQGDLAARFPTSIGLRAKLNEPVPPCLELLHRLGLTQRPPSEPTKPAFEDIVFSFHFGAMAEEDLYDDFFDDADWVTENLSGRALSTTGSDADRVLRLQGAIGRECGATRAQTLVFSADEGTCTPHALTFNIPTSNSATFARLFARNAHLEQHGEDGIIEHDCSLQVLLTDGRSRKVCAIDTSSHEMEYDDDRQDGGWREDIFLRDAGQWGERAPERADSMRWVIASMTDNNVCLSSSSTYTSLLYACVRETESNTFTISIKCLKIGVHDGSGNNDCFDERHDTELFGQGCCGKIKFKHAGQAFIDRCHFV